MLIRFFHCRFSDRSGGSGLEQRWPRVLAGCVFPWDGEIKETVYLDDVGRCAHLHKPQYNRWLSLIITLTKKRRAPAHSNAAEASCVHANIGLQYSISHLEKDWVNFKPLLFFFEHQMVSDLLAYHDPVRPVGLSGFLICISVCGLSLLVSCKLNVFLRKLFKWRTFTLLLIEMPVWIK